MSIRNDLVVDWEVSPRVITVLLPSTEITVQDLHDSCRFLEAESAAMDDPKLIDSSGLEQLDTSTKVGLTSTLQNALVAFEARFGPEYIQCNISGGNVVAIDNVGVYYKTPVYPTAFTQVVVTASSSATIQTQDDIRYSTYQNAANLDITSDNVGTDYPSGNVENPVNNVEDAVAICHLKKFKTIRVTGSLNSNSITHDLSYLQLVGTSHINSILTIGPDTICNNTDFDHFDISGTLDGDSSISNCVVINIDFFNGHIHDSLLKGTIKLQGDTDANIINCSIGDVENPPTMDCTNLTKNLMMPGWSGSLIIDNLVSNSKIGIGLNAGLVEVLPSCTGGMISIFGVGAINDNSAGALVNDQVVDAKDIHEIQQNTDDIHKVNYNKRNTINNIITIYEEDGVTIHKQFNTDTNITYIDPI